MTKQEEKKETTFEVVLSIFKMLIIILFFYTFAFQNFNIPTASMVPTLLVGDYIIVSKYAYGYSKYTFPFWTPPIEGRFFAKLPDRGDIAVFRLPRDPEQVYIKRIIGLPGDHLQVKQGQLFLNGAAVPREPIDPLLTDDSGLPPPVVQYTETLPNGVKHPILQPDLNPEADNTKEYVVPDGYVFGIGDNRDNSTDSRYQNDVGYIPVQNLVGRAEFRYWSVDRPKVWWDIVGWVTGIRFSRIFSGVH